MRGRADAAFDQAAHGSGEGRRRRLGQGTSARPTGLEKQARPTSRPGPHPEMEAEMERKDKPLPASRHRGGSGNFAADPKRAAEAGHKGGQRSGGNFARDRERAAEAGRKGGQHSHGGR